MRTIVLGALFALVACGHNRGEETKGTYFIPRTALAVLGNDAKVVGTHDSGLLVEADAEQGKSLLASTPYSFRFDQWKPEHSAYTYETMEQKIQELSHKFPGLVTVDTYGTSIEGRKEYVLTLHNKAKATPGPEVMITGATHGNEIATVDVVLGLAEKMLAGHGKDTRFTAMLDSHTVYIIPAVCVDSYVAQTRENEDTDPNRSYPYPQDTAGHPTHAIQDMMAFFKAHDIVGSMDYHSAASMIMFPWAYTYDKIPTPDYQAFDSLTTKMAATNGYAHGDIADTIYVAPGSSADYWYWTHHTVGLGVELSHDFAASHDPSDLVAENAESTWLFIENFRG